MHTRKITSSSFAYQYALSTDAINLNNGPAMHTSSPEYPLIQSFFKVATGSTWQTNNAEFKAKTKHADVFYATINAFGLPMSVIMDGGGFHADPDEIKSISIKLMDMLNQIAHTIQNSSLSDKEITLKVKSLYRALDCSLQFKYISNASMAAAIIYQNDQGQSKVLSFGTGGTMIVLDTQEKLIPLIWAMSDREGRPIPFPSDNFKGANIETALKYLQVTTHNVFFGERLFFLTDGIYENLQLASSTTKDALMLCCCLKSDAILQSETVTNISDNIFKKVMNEFSYRRDQKIEITQGDDATIAEVKIPDYYTQVKCAFWIALENYIRDRADISRKQGVDLKDSFFSMFSKYFENSSDGYTKLSAAQKMIDALQEIVVSFSVDEIYALRSSGIGRTIDNPGLGQIVSKYEELDAVPDSFYLSEYALESSNSSYYSL